MSNEAAFQRAVLDLAGYLGWLRHHDLPSQRADGPMNQDDWISALRGVPGLEVYVWRPQDWPTIERILKKAPQPVEVEHYEIEAWPI